MAAPDPHYCIHRVLAQPLGWSAIGAAAADINASLGAKGGALFGAWRSQIGRPRDEVSLISKWPDGCDPTAAEAALLAPLGPVRLTTTRAMTPTLRPGPNDAAPTRQGNYAFRWFTLSEPNLPEFLDLCAGAWPGFEAAYDSQIIGMWRLESAVTGKVDVLLMTRRPDLAMWERSKLPATPAEAEVRAKLSRRYDLCDDTEVATSTLLTASDQADSARWT